MRYAAIGLLAIVLAGCTLSAPPPERGRAPILTPLPPPADAEFELPSRRPSVASGAAIYAEKCVACHGPAGQGDGEQAAQVQQQFGAAPANLVTDSGARASTPAEWYAVITGGRIERGMPPFRGSLSIDARWDVIAYVWSLAATESRLAAGAATYAERCVQCHGETGKGDGPQADATVPDLSNLAAYRDVAPGEWDSWLEIGHVPSFGGKLTAAERNGVNDYLRSFTYETTPAVAELPAATAAPGPAADEPVSGFTVNGTIVNGTSGASVPAGLEVTLYMFPGGTGSQAITQTLRADASGRFSAPDLDPAPGSVVAATVTYAEVTYPSGLATFDGTASSADLQIHIYEPTPSAAAVRIDTLHVIVTPRSDAIDVNEIYVISNLGDRVIRNLDGPALRFALPAAATAFRMQDGAAEGTVVQSTDGFDYYDAIAPGEQTLQLVIAYQMPLDAADLVFDRVVPYQTRAVNFLVQDTSMAASSAELLDRGPQVIQNQTYRQFSGGPLAAGQQLTFRLARQAAGVDTRLVAGIVLLVVGVVAAGYGLWRSRAREGQPAPARRPAEMAAERERLLDEIAALDDAFEAGKIDNAQYTKKRDALKKDLLRLTRRE